jgi:hypothetical protein
MPSNLPPISAFPPRQLLLRSLALAFAMLGGIICLIVGIVLLRVSELAEENAGNGATDHYLGLVRGSLLLSVGLLACFGGLFAFWRRRWPALALLLIATFAPMLLQPLFFLLTFPCLIGAVLTVPIRPHQQAMPKGTIQQ